MAKAVSQFFIAKENSALQAWLRHFDKNGNGMIDFDEFSLGMRALQWEGNLRELWKQMDVDGSGELTLDEIDRESASIWRKFRAWSAIRFESDVDMISKLGDGMKITSPQFMKRVPTLGWAGQLEELLFGCMDHNGSGVITTDNLRWFDEEKKRQKRKQRAKAAAANNAERRIKEKLVCTKSLADFKDFLRRRQGCLYRAWRRDLDTQGTLSVVQKDLFKSCRVMGWNGDVRALWKGLDADDSGVTTLTEVDASSARYLALLKHWADNEFGSAEVAFTAIQKKDSRKAKKSEFLVFAQRFGYPGSKSEISKIFNFLDWEGKKYLLQADFVFLQAWRPPTWLIAQPNPEAAEQLKTVLTRKYRHLVKAWRVAMDKDGSNRLSWGEFEEGCKRVGFKGDVPGAWLTLDEDLSGAITLGELDPKGYKALMDLKSWADAEFGGVRSAFRVLDVDGSGSLTFLEFKRAIHDYGFTGDCLRLFLSLDCDGRGEISLFEVAFLDQWVPDDVVLMARPTQDLTQTQSTMTLGGQNSYNLGPSISQVAEVASWFALQRRARMENRHSLRSTQDCIPGMTLENMSTQPQNATGAEVQARDHLCSQVNSQQATKISTGQKATPKQPLGSLSGTWSLNSSMKSPKPVDGLTDNAPLSPSWSSSIKKENPAWGEALRGGNTWPQQKKESMQGPWSLLYPTNQPTLKKQSPTSPREIFSSPYAIVPQSNSTPRKKKPATQGKGVAPQKLCNIGPFGF